MPTRAVRFPDGFRLSFEPKAVLLSGPGAPAVRLGNLVTVAGAGSSCRLRVSGARPFEGGYNFLGRHSVFPRCA